MAALLLVGGDGFLDGPARFEYLLVGANILHVLHLTHLDEIHDLTLPFKQPVVLAVPGLLSTGPPFAVLRGVITVVVHALNRVMLGGSRPHIFDESLEIKLPGWVEFYPSGTVPAVSRVHLVVAPCLHCQPNGVKGVPTIVIQVFMPILGRGFQKLST